MDKWIKWGLILTFLGTLSAGGYYWFDTYTKPNTEDLNAQKAGGMAAYQVRLERRIEEGFRHILSKVVGNDHFQVSVIANLDLTSQKEESTSMTPDTVSVDNSSEVEEKKPAPDNEPKEAILEQSFELPGFFDSSGQSEADKGFSVNSLPGFPELPSTTATPKPIKAPASAVPVGNGLRSMGMSVTKQTSKQVYYNQSKKEKVVDSKIKNIMVTIVIDEELIEKGVFDKNKLLALLNTLAPIDKARGDTMTISFMPFNKPLINPDSIKNTVVSILALIMCICTGYGLVKFLAYKQKQGAEAKRLRAEEDAKKAHELTLQEAAEIAKHEKDKEFLLQAIDNQPDVVAHSILDWVESFSNPEKQEEGSGKKKGHKK
jgi:flagellar biosynthesis/type III secretory pathway M-ring protein FliF/YscJ